MQFCLLNKTVESRTHRNLPLFTAFVSTEGCHVFLCRESYYFMIHEIKNRNFKKIEQKDEKMWRRKWREAALSFYCLIITVFIFTNSIIYHSIALFMLFQMILNSNCHICNFKSHFYPLPMAFRVSTDSWTGQTDYQRPVSQCLKSIKSRKMVALLFPFLPIKQRVSS